MKEKQPKKPPTKKAKIVHFEEDDDDDDFTGQGQFFNSKVACLDAPLLIKAV